ncbi:dihydrofolate reductase [Salipaludibacillus keqinensis]|uniref:Dihydrofolate reductase n=1 Tax=Salipaludibacillus keqinensis TaxID=2045207 RepID=A0A323TR47_9BACI|nr:D-2-hydroxyacid dehydrogenase [Salipaludibacillus keqinensis]PYZ95003.1 dihydrofolate reductase [Salipaludibacillus keqinensis]
MDIKNILFVSPMYKDIQSILNDKRVNEEKQFRFRSEEDVVEEDYLWADGFVSFKRPDNFSFANMKWVHSFGAGVDKILQGEPWKEDVVLTRTISSFGQKISEYCLSYILGDVQKHDTYEELKNEKDWNPLVPIPLHEKQAVIYGTGVIGQEVAKTLSYFGVKVYGVSLSGNKKDHFQDVFSSESDYTHILAKTEYVINTMPLTEKTKEMFHSTLFSHMNEAMFINVGRGESVSNQDLLEALTKKNVRFAVLDVFHEEPLPKEDPFWAHPQVTVTPHISAVTTPNEGVDCFLETLDRLEKDQPLLNEVDLSKGF